MSKHDSNAARLNQEELILALDQLDQAVMVVGSISQRIRRGIMAAVNTDQQELPFQDEVAPGVVH